MAKNQPPFSFHINSMQLHHPGIVPSTRFSAIAKTVNRVITCFFLISFSSFFADAQHFCIILYHANARCQDFRLNVVKSWTPTQTSAFGYCDKYDFRTELIFRFGCAIMEAQRLQQRSVKI